MYYFSLNLAFFLDFFFVDSQVKESVKFFHLLISEFWYRKEFMHKSVMYLDKYCQVIICDCRVWNPNASAEYPNSILKFGKLLIDVYGFVVMKGVNFEYLLFLMIILNKLSEIPITSCILVSPIWCKRKSWDLDYL